MGERRDLTLAVATLLTLGVAVLGGLESSRWIGRSFPGFLLLENRVVASAGLAHWPAAGAGIFQHELLAVDGVPLDDARELGPRVASLPTGTPVRYTLRLGDREVERQISTRRFSAVDFVLLFGSYLLGGLCMCGVALVIRLLRPEDRVARGTATALWILGMWGLTATDLYGPYRLFRLHAALECFVFAGMVHVALIFPYPRRILELSPRILPMTWLAAAVLAAVSQLTLFDPSAYALTHRVAVALFGGSLLFVIASQLRAFVRPPNFEARQRVKVLVMGVVASLAPGALLSLSSAASGGQATENAMGWTGVVFPLAVGYSVLRSDLFEVDEILRRSVNYVLLSALVTLTFAAAFAGLTALRGEPDGGNTALLLALAGTSVVLLLPLRDRLQSAVDRVFFRSAYDFRRVIETASERLASARELGVVAREIEEAVTQVLHPASIAFQVSRLEEGGEERVDAFGRPPDALHPQLAALPWGDALREGEDGSLAVPFRAEKRIVARLLLGRRLSGGLYTGDDRRFLKTLANQGAVAVENALALEQLRDLNRDLERKVEERTTELAGAFERLRAAQDQLVHQEKMASLGQLVAGIAHEINNPLNFIEGNLHFMREYAAALKETLERSRQLALGSAPQLETAFEELWAERELDYVLGDLQSTLDGCREGVDRATTIVRDLRTFSRSGSGERSDFDVHQALESTLTLLGGRLKHVRIVREYGSLPAIRACEGQMKQVFMNLLANAADAVDDGGRITLRTRRLGADRVEIEVEDDGCGIEPSDLEHIFEPFYTTKQVGHGTGLGLSITYGVVADHGGTIRAQSAVGAGTRFSVELPLADQEAAADSPASGSGGAEA